jgi:hypothetical protein
VVLGIEPRVLCMLDKRCIIWVKISPLPINLNLSYAYNKNGEQNNLPSLSGVMAHGFKSSTQEAEAGE